MNKTEMIKKYFNKRTSSEILKTDTEGINEIRIRRDKPVILKGTEKETVCGCIVNSDEIEEILGRMTEFSVYAFNSSIRQGFITLQGGYRVGIGGRAVIDGGTIKTIKDVTSLNIRIPKNIKGCGNEAVRLYENGFRNTLIVSPPGCGKTTLLRDIIRQLSNGGYTVGVCDEREELNCFNDLGLRTDVVAGCGKAEGISILVRGLSPDIVAADELGDGRDIAAIRAAAYMGVGILCTIHGDAVREELKPYFDIFIILKPLKGKGEISGIIDKEL